MRRWDVWAVIVGVALFPIARAHAEISRGCTATISVGLVGQASTYLPIAEIEGRGTCKNSAHANDCRRRARAAIDDCRNALWNGRQGDTLPAACRTLSAGRQGARVIYREVLSIAHSSRFIVRIEHVACCTLAPHSDSISVNIGGAVAGDKECGSIKIGKNKYQDEFNVQLDIPLDCSTLRPQVCGN
jgi:hypothetical protein